MILLLLLQEIILMATILMLLLSVKIRGSYNFPASATIASQTGTTVTGAQINPSVGDYVASNIANPNQPVILLNGVQVALQTALDIDINRIEKITILKDAAATSIYGVRGGTGVLLIQTKQPQKGDFRVTYSGQVQITTPDLSSYSLWNAPKNYSWRMTPVIIITILLYTKVVYTRLTKGSIRIGLIYQPGQESAANIPYHLKAVMMI